MFGFRPVEACKECKGPIMVGEECSRCLRKELNAECKEVIRLNQIIINYAIRAFDIISKNMVG